MKSFLSILFGKQSLRRYSRTEILYSTRGDAIGGSKSRGQLVDLIGFRLGQSVMISDEIHWLLVVAYSVLKNDCISKCLGILGLGLLGAEGVLHSRYRFYTRQRCQLVCRCCYVRQTHGDSAQCCLICSLTEHIPDIRVPWWGFY